MASGRCGERAEALVMGPRSAATSSQQQAAASAAAMSQFPATGIWRQRDVFDTMTLPPLPMSGYEETWEHVCSYIMNHFLNESEGSDSAQSSLSSVGATTGSAQTSPKSSSIWNVDDSSPRLFDPQPSFFDPAPAPPLPPSRPVETSSPANQEYKLINELLKLNLGSQLQNYTPSHPSTSSPWGLPEEPTYRHVQQHQRVPQHEPQQQQSHWRNEPENDVFSHLNMPDMFMMPPVPPHLLRPTTAAMELQMRLDECCEEYKQLEKERKQTEAELARHNLGKKISSSNGLPIPRLPTAPSRMDRLIVDFFREHARISTLLGKMEKLRGLQLMPSVHYALKELLEAVTLLQHLRINERTAILQQLRGEAVCYNEEKESIAMAQALIKVRHAAVRARAANWCSLVWTLGPEDPVQEAQVDRLVHSDFTIRPPPIRPRPIKQ